MWLNNELLKLKFNPLFEKPRRPNLHRFDKFVICGAKSFSLQLVNSKITFHFSKRLVQSHVQYCKKQMSWQAQYNKNIKLTIDKPEKYRTWIMGEQLGSQRDTLAQDDFLRRNLDCEVPATRVETPRVRVQGEVIKVHDEEKAATFKRKVIIGQSSKEEV